MSNWKKIEISTPNGKFLEKTEKSEFFYISVYPQLYELYCCTKHQKWKMDILMTSQKEKVGKFHYFPLFPVILCFGGKKIFSKLL